MYICVCNALREDDLRQEMDKGARTIQDLAMRTGAGASCGSCVSQLKEFVDHHLEENPPSVSPTLKHDLPLLASSRIHNSRSCHTDPAPAKNTSKKRDF